MFKVVTDFTQAQWLLTCPVFAVDIETETAVPEDSDWDELDAADGSYGVSFVTDMTVVSFFHPDHPPVVIRDPYLSDHTDFIRRVFDREHYTIIGHSAIFDLRSLGGHMGFDLLRHGIRVWDTERMSLALLFGAPRDRDSSSTTESELSLEAQVTRQNLYRNEIEMRFFEAMKVHRKELSAMPEIMQNEPPESILWQFVGGYPAEWLDNGEIIPRDEAIPFAHKAIDLYVALDAVYAFLLYERHLAYIDDVKDKNVRLPIHRRQDIDGVIKLLPIHELRVPKWPQLPRLVQWEQRISWASAIQAIRGVQFDKNYADKKLNESLATRDEALEQVLTIADESNPYDGWEEVFQTIYWYSRIFDTVKAGKTYSSPDLRGERAWVHWNPYSVDEQTIMDSMSFDRSVDTEEDEERRKFWLEWLAPITPEWKRADLKKALPPDVDVLDIPYIDIFNFVRQQSHWSTDEEMIVDYLTRTKLNWLEYYYTQRKPLTPDKIVTKGSWIPYHLFVVCKIPIPSEEDFRQNWDITTKKHGQRVRQLGGDSNPKFSFRALALREGYMSAGKGAIRFYLDQDIDDAPNFMHFRRFVDADSNIQRITEYMAHASRDGFIHSAITNTARTTRGRSRGPNLQNLPMRGEEAGWRGYLIAPGPRRFVEVDISNAENVHGAVISRDDAFAYAVMSTDFHAMMRDSYWPDLMETFKQQAAAGDHDAIKLLALHRDLSKRVTFGDFYGAGVRKIARELNCSMEEAAAIKRRKEQSFPQVTAKRAEIEDSCKARVRQGFFPAYVSLWEGSRVPVDAKLNDFNINTYMTWNYTLQGGIGRIVARARAELVEMEIDAPRLADGLPRNFVGMDVHDALITCAEEDEDNYQQYALTVIQRLCSQVPSSALERTIPHLRYVAEVGPENAEKWGWKDGEPYPFSLKRFVNQWGVWDLPEDELAKPPRDREAPSWKGPVHEGWTVDAEVARLRHEQEINVRQNIAQEHNNGSAIRVDVVGEEWAQMAQILNYYPSMLKTLVDSRDRVEQMLRVHRISYTDKEGNEKQTEPLNFTNFMAAAQGLVSLGHTIPTYDDNLSHIHEIIHMRRVMSDWLQMVDAWVQAHGTEYLPERNVEIARKVLGSGDKKRRL